MGDPVRAARRRPVGGALTAALFITALLLPGAPSTAQEVQSGAEAGVKDDGAIYLNALEVTANKRPQRLGEVDGSVSVRTGEDLREANITRVDELDKVFPGLVIRTRGNRAYSNISLRGVTSSDFYNPAVQVYVDGVPQDPAFFTQELVNVERVEVLRGPQGTLYGRNAHGGVINIITRQPGPDFTGRLRGTLSTGEKIAEGGISGTLVHDTLFGSLDLRRVDDPGRIDDIATGAENIDDGDNWTGRARLRFAPADSPLEISVAARRDELESHHEIYLAESRVHDLEYDSATQGPVNDTHRIVNSYDFTMSYDFDGATLSSITSYQDRDMEKRLIQGFDTPEFQDTLAQELRLNFGFGERWTGVAGLFYQNAEFERRTPAFAPFFGSSTNRVDTDSYAVFGELTYALTDRIDLTGGLRWSREDATVDYARQMPLELSIDDDDSFQDISPKVTLGWQVSDAHRLYALASRGFKPGGFNHTLPFAVMDPGVALAYESETSTNLEAGWRGAFFDGRIEAGAAAYWILTEDKQIYVGPMGSQYLRNAGDAESYGLELDAQAWASDDLRLDVGATLGRSVFTDAVDPETGVSYDGNRLPYAPDYSFQLAAHYYLPESILPQTFLQGDLGFRVAGRYIAETYFDEANDLSQAGYALFDASVDLELDNGFSVSLFAENITDKIYRTYSYASGGNVFSSVGDGRIVGITGRFEF